MTQPKEHVLLQFNRADRDEYRGLYYEEVGKIVDGIESEIIDKNIESKSDARSWLDESIATSDWTSEMPWMIHTLCFSEHACAAFYEYELAPAWLHGLHQVREQVNGPVRNPPPYRKGNEFPFADLANVAMTCDCQEELNRRQVYRDLP